MRILHINDECNVSFNLTAGLKLLGHDAEVWVEPRPDARYSLAVKLLFLPYRLAEFARVNSKVHKGRYDIVHIHDAYIGWIGILGKYRYYLHCHGSDVRLGLYHPIRKIWTIPALSRAYKVFYTTPDLAEHLQRVRPDAIYLPNPIRTDIFCPEHVELPSRDPRILLFCAFDDDVKGTPVAISALTQLHNRYPEVQISAIKFGKDIGKYSSLSWIDFLDPVPSSEVPKLLNQFDIVVGQFSIGSIGVAELEAMSCAKPVVCFYNNHPEAYSEAPPVLSANDPQGATENLSKLVEYPDYRSSLGQQGRAWVQQYHDYLSVTKRLVEVYDCGD